MFRVHPDDVGFTAAIFSRFPFSSSSRFLRVSIGSWGKKRRDDGSLFPVDLDTGNGETRRRELWRWAGTTKLVLLPWCALYTPTGAAVAERRHRRLPTGARWFVSKRNCLPLAREKIREQERERERERMEMTSANRCWNVPVGWGMEKYDRVHTV